MSEPKRIRVMLVDDHEMVRTGLALFIRSSEDLELVGQAANGLEAIALCPECLPDVVLMDLVMPEMDGIEAIRYLRSSQPAPQCVALTSFVEHDLVQQALAAGAIGFILKNASVSEITSAIHAAYEGKPALAAEALRELVRTPAVQAPRGANLTNREREILGLLADGLSNQQIARRLVINLSTVKTHVSSILGKLGAANRAEAVAIALHHNLTGTADQPD